MMDFTPTLELHHDELLLFRNLLKQHLADTNDRLTDMQKSIDFHVKEHGKAKSFTQSMMRRHSTLAKMREEWQKTYMDLDSHLACTKSKSTHVNHNNQNL